MNLENEQIRSKNPDVKDYIFYDYIYVKGSERANPRGTKQISGRLGLRIGMWIDSRYKGSFGAMEIF